jgi:hypothetical protein
MIPRKFTVYVLVLTLVLMIAACGSETDSEEPIGVAKITASERIFTLDDLAAVDFKKSKTYDVEGLTGASKAYYGFWGLDQYDRKDFEIRFYDSHTDAVELGTPFAEDRAGETAVIKSDETMWAEGIKDARACTRLGGSANCQVPKYGDYVIFGNMILLCQGRDSATAMEQCTALIEQLDPTFGISS